MCGLGDLQHFATTGNTANFAVLPVAYEYIKTQWHCSLFMFDVAVASPSLTFPPYPSPSCHLGNITTNLYYYCVKIVVP
jgi:hypothetical protein